MPSWLSTKHFQLRLRACCWVTFLFFTPQVAVETACTPCVLGSRRVPVGAGLTVVEPAQVGRAHGFQSCSPGRLQAALTEWWHLGAHALLSLCARVQATSGGSTQQPCVYSRPFLPEQPLARNQFNYFTHFCGARFKNHNDDDTNSRLICISNKRGMRNFFSRQ